MRHYNMYDYYDYGSSYEETIVMGIVMIIMIILIVSAIFSLGSYILRGIGMYTIAKRIGLDYAWLAFVPFARTYLHGELSGSILLKKKRIQNPGIWLLALPFLYGAVYSILYTILWFMGFGALMSMDFDSYYMPYSGISTGTIMGIVIVFLIFMVISIGYTAFYKAFQVLVNHQILERFTTKNMSIVHAVLCTIIPMYESICFFVMRNRPFNPGMEPPTPTPFMQSPPPGPYYDNSGQTGYPGSSMQGGYGNYNGSSATSDTNSYSSYGGASASSDTNGYSSYGGASASSDTNGYSSYGGASASSDTNSYSSYGGASASSDTNGYSSYGGVSTSSDTNGYSSYGGISTPSDADNYGNLSGQSAQAGAGYNSYGTTSENALDKATGNSQTGSNVNFVLPGNEGAKSQPPTEEGSKPEDGLSEDKHTEPN